MFKFDFLTAGPAVQRDLPTNDSCLSSHRHFLRVGPGLTVPETSGRTYCSLKVVFSVGESTLRNEPLDAQPFYPYILIRRPGAKLRVRLRPLSPPPTFPHPNSAPTLNPSVFCSLRSGSCARTWPSRTWIWLRSGRRHCKPHTCSASHAAATRW